MLKCWKLRLSVLEFWSANKDIYRLLRLWRLTFSSNINRRYKEDETCGTNIYSGENFRFRIVNAIESRTLMFMSDWIYSVSILIDPLAILQVEMVAAELSISSVFLLLKTRVVICWSWLPRCSSSKKVCREPSPLSRLQFAVAGDPI